MGDGRWRNVCNDEQAQIAEGSEFQTKDSIIWQHASEAQLLSYIHLHRQQLQLDREISTMITMIITTISYLSSNIKLFQFHM